MSEKVPLPKEVAEAIGSVKEFYTNAEIIGTIVTDRGCTAYGSQIPTLIEYSRKAEGNLDALMSALVNGYEIEKTPEEKVCEFFDYLETQYRENLLNRDASKYHLAIVTLKRVLNDLGIKIAGVNA
jgi:hypothetical protein